VAVCSFSNDGSKFSICYSSGEIFVWDTDHGTLVDETIIRDGPASNVSFLGRSNTILLICTKKYTCWRWETIGGLHSVVKICDAEMARSVRGAVVSQKSCFYENGIKIVFCTILDTQEGRTLSIERANTTSILPYRCFNNLDPVSIRDNFVFSIVAMSGDGKGILVGLMDHQMNDTYCILWPDIDEYPHRHETLTPGTIGSWSIDSKYVVTWTMLQGSSLEDDTTSSAFVWNVDERRQNRENDHLSLDSIKLTNPFGENIFWCQLSSDIDEKPRLIMGVVGRRARFLFWDIESEIHTHVINTGISAKDMMLLNRDAWIESRVKKKNVKGLCPMTISPHGTKFGGVLGCPTKVLVWDAHLGVELMRVAPKDLQSNWLSGGLDALICLSSRKCAIVGADRAMVLCPSASNSDKDHEENVLETQMVEFDNRHTSQMKHPKHKLCFSGDGNSLGVLCIGLQKMQVWNLLRGTSCVIDTTHSSSRSIQDFCISCNGKYLVTYKRHCIQIWDCEAKLEGDMICRIDIDCEVVAMGINNVGSEVLLCIKDGSIRWYEVLIEDFNASDLHMRGVSGASSSYDDFLLEDSIRPWSRRSRNSIERPLINEDVSDSHLPRGSTSIEIHSHPVHVKYKDHVLTEGLEASSFQVSPTFDQVIRIFGPQGIEAWDLKQKTKIHNVPINARCIPTPPIHYSPSSFIYERAHEELQSQKMTLLEGTNVTLTKQTTVVQASQEHIVVASENPSSCLTNEDASNTFDDVFRKERARGSHSVYV